jgi:hypothetical protein
MSSNKKENWIVKKIRNNPVKMIGILLNCIGIVLLLLTYSVFSNSDVVLIVGISLILLGSIILIIILSV